MWNLRIIGPSEKRISRLPSQGVKVEEVITSYTLLVHVAMPPDMPHYAIVESEKG